MLLKHYPAHFLSPLLYYKEASLSLVGGLVSFWQFFWVCIQEKKLSPYYVMNVTIYGEVMFQS